MDFPEFVMMVLKRLRAYGYEAYVVGGAVRDLIMNRPVADWDIATSAAADEIRTVFTDIKSFSLKHDTVTLVHGGRNYEVSGFRGGRLARRAIEADLGHRDFTMNAMAYDPMKGEILDPFNGRRDIGRKLVKAVADPKGRFLEDPLRILRAVRFAAQFGFNIDPETGRVAVSMADRLSVVSRERIREELVKLLLVLKPSRGILLMKRLGLLEMVIPELLEGVGRRQNPEYHRYTIFRHTLETLDRVEPDLHLRLAALLHDIAKPRVREKIAGKYRFYGHDKASAGLAKEIMERLRFGKVDIETVTNLVAYHMRDLDYREDWSDAAVRRLIRQIGEQYLDLFLSLRRADLRAHGVVDRKLRLFSDLENRIRNLLQNPFPKRKRELAVDGHKVMEVLGLSPGPEVGRVLDLLMEKVIDDPAMNTEGSLLHFLGYMKAGQGGEGDSLRARGRDCKKGGREDAQ